MSVIHFHQVPPVSEENPDGNLFYNSSTLLAHEADAKRVIAPERARKWKVVNHASHNYLGAPVGYVGTSPLCVSRRDL